MTPRAWRISWAGRPEHVAAQEGDGPAGRRRTSGWAPLRRTGMTANAAASAPGRTQRVASDWWARVGGPARHRECGLPGSLPEAQVSTTPGCSAEGLRRVGRRCRCEADGAPRCPRTPASRARRRWVWGCCAAGGRRGSRWPPRCRTPTPHDGLGPCRASRRGQAHRQRPGRRVSPALVPRWPPRSPRRPARPQGVVWARSRSPRPPHGQGRCGGPPRSPRRCGCTAEHPAQRSSTRSARGSTPAASGRRSSLPATGFSSSGSSPPARLASRTRPGMTPVSGSPPAA